MNEIICPHCKKAIKVDEAGYAAIERLRDMKARLSTKMVGETLEQHCETEFNRIRATLNSKGLRPNPFSICTQRVE